jgi:hypothetical protein
MSVCAEVVCHTKFRTSEKWRVTLGLVLSLNEILKLPLDWRRDCRCREHKEGTRKKFTIFIKMMELCLNEDNLLNKLQRKFNVEESDIQLIKTPENL